MHALKVYNQRELSNEFYHKHAVVAPPALPSAESMSEGEARARYLREGLWAEGVYTDPLIRFEGDRWVLYPAKVPASSARALLSIEPVTSDAERDRFL